jgi:hypothetical protein
MEPERPNDLGKRAIPTELEIGKKYYYRTFGPYMKLTITRKRYGPNGYMWVDGVYENGTEVGPLGIDRTDYNKFYHLNPKPDLYIENPLIIHFGRSSKSCKKIFRCTTAKGSGSGRRKF